MMQEKMKERGQGSSPLVGKMGASVEVKGLLTKIFLKKRKRNQQQQKLGHEQFIITREEKAVFMSVDMHVPVSGWRWSWKNMGMLFWVLLGADFQ